MKTTGVIRKLDELGRITLPIELRRSLDLDVKDGVGVQRDAVVLLDILRQISLPAAPKICWNTRERKFPEAPF